MPFKDVSKMDSRKRLVLDVRSGMSLSGACRLAGVSRKTGRKWVKRALEVGLENLQEESRAPHQKPLATDAKKVDALLSLKEKYSAWGPKKLVVLLKDDGIELPLRTAERLLSRRGLTCPNPGQVSPMERFEREHPCQLYQMDFKGLPKSVPYSLLSVIDDCSRFCLALEPVRDKTGVSVRECLWNLFGVHGLPEAMLMDNGDCWGSVASRIPTAFEAWLLRLGVKPIHGRPWHPQTQGKVERFHKTLEHELGGALFQPSLEEAQLAYRPFVEQFNWVRPHEALGGAVPGSLYRKSSRPRPEREPLHEIPECAVSRMVDQLGFISYKGSEYKVGLGLIRERVVLKEMETGLGIFYAGFFLIRLQDLPCRK